MKSLALVIPKKQILACTHFLPSIQNRPIERIFKSPSYSACHVSEVPDQSNQSRDVCSNWIAHFLSQSSQPCMDMPGKWPCMQEDAEAVSVPGALHCPGPCHLAGLPRGPQALVILQDSPGAH